MLGAMLERTRVACFLANYIGFAVEADYQLQPNYFVGLTIEGGIAAITRQTGGPVISLYFAHRF